MFQFLDIFLDGVYAWNALSNCETNGYNYSKTYIVHVIQHLFWIRNICKCLILVFVGYIYFEETLY